MKTYHKIIMEAFHEYNKRSLRSVRDALIAATSADSFFLNFIIFNIGGGGDPVLLFPLQAPMMPVAATSVMV
jgi:hypothetical protein